MRPIKYSIFKSSFDEILLQSHGEYIEPLSALPKAWDTGEYYGLVARGNFIWDVSWKDSMPVTFTVHAKSGGNLKIRYKNITKAKVYINDTFVNKEVVNPDLLELKTDINDKIEIVF